MNLLREDERYLYGLVKLSLEEGKQYVSIGTGFMMELLVRLKEARGDALELMRQRGAIAVVRERSGAGEI